MSNFKEIVDLVQHAIDKGAPTVEQIHKEISNLSFNTLERLGLLTGPAKEVKNVNDDIVNVVYNAIHSVNKTVEDLKAKNESLTKLDKLKDEFLANTSHELRTPLNGIIGIAESLVDGATGRLPQQTQNNLNLIIQSGKRLANLINDILDFSRLLNHELQLDLGPVDLKSLAEVVLAISKTLIGQKTVKLVNRIPDDLPLIEGDENRLQQILLNLVGNAIKFTHQGEVHISAELKKEQVQVFVKDTGIGIALDKQSRIFESFEQADGSTAREYGGTGLGLSITKNLVELHGGTIEVESTEQVGSIFSFSLPVANDLTPSKKPSEVILQSIKIPTEETGTPAKSLKSTAFTAEPGAKTILVVDDEPVNIQVIQNHLNMNQYRVLTAHDGFQALEILKQEKPDLMVLDLMMPRMSGYEVVRKVRESHSPTSLPIIILTAKNQVSDLLEGFERGTNDYITKPFSKDELFSRIRSHLNISQTTSAYERFVPREFLEHLSKESIIDVRLGDHIKGRMSVLFSDIRSFTTLSESMKPKENFNFLNAYLSRMEPLITENNGFIDKYIGDAIMAIFADHPDDALSAAIAMSRTLEDYNQSRKKAGYKLIKMGIGINTGDLMLGTIGGLNRMEGTVISDAVNLASRVEGMTKMYGASILISDRTYHSLKSPDNYSMRLVDKVIVKGKTEPVTVWEVLDGQPHDIFSARLAIKKTFEEAISLYHVQQFQEAMELLTECLLQNPDDKAVHIYMDRCRHYLKFEWDEHWDGVTRLDTK